jgi:glycosyltransferase involved in cell wall biosynthesis
MSEIRVLIIQNYITHYNLPVYRLLGMEPGIDLTIAHYGKPGEKSEPGFKEIILSTGKIGPFYFFNQSIYRLCNGYDVVIAMGDIHFLSLMMLGKRIKRNYRLIYWGIGVSASYTNKLDQSKKWDFIRFFFMKGADGLIFYSDYPVNKYISKGFAREKLFVAPNTVSVTRTSEESFEKDSLLFIGTLYKEKGIYELLSAYKAATEKCKSIPVLNIIGSGDEYSNIESWIISNDLTSKIFLRGAIFKDIDLEPYFQKALITVSPHQAGLSVLKSMGFGVPFITRFDSITGGERFNIVNNETGIIYNTEDELVEIICDLEKNRSKYVEMGKKATRFYMANRLPSHMVKGFLDAINFVLKNK